MRWRPALAIALLAAAIPAAAQVAVANVEAAFTPGDDIASMIVKRIGGARESVQMQAYLLTDRRIANALLAARKRGLAVEVIADASQQESGGARYLRALERSGARVYLNASVAAAHNKILILDGGRDSAAVITGSYNYTQAANTRNAENVVVLSGSRALTDRFVENFAYHRALSRPWP